VFLRVSSNPQRRQHYMLGEVHSIDDQCDQLKAAQIAPQQLSARDPLDERAMEQMMRLGVSTRRYSRC
jgi:hypothetical protein